MCLLFAFIFFKTKMEAIAMNDLLQQLHDLVPAFNVASIPRDATSVFASPVHIIAGLLNNKVETNKKSLNKLGANINGNCTKMKVFVNGRYNAVGVIGVSTTYGSNCITISFFFFFI